MGERWGGTGGSGGEYRGIIRESIGVVRAE